MLRSKYGEHKADEIWQNANKEYLALQSEYPDENEGYMIFPATALYKSLPSEDKMPFIKEYGAQIGIKMKKIMHSVTSVPGVSFLVKKNLVPIMRNMSSEKKGYRRKVTSETSEMVGVDITLCPLYELSKKIGCPESCQCICAADKIYMTGIKGVRYERTKSVAEGDDVCDYKLYPEK